MARQSFTREEALQYLAGRTDLTFKKPLDSYKTPYLKRLASEYKRAEQAGKVAPSRKEVRGKAKERIQYHEANNYFSESWEVGNKRYPVKFEELSQFLAKVGEHKFYNVIIFGIPKNYGAGWADPRKPDYRSFRRDRMTIRNDMEDAQGNIKDFADRISGFEWTKVYAIAMRQGAENPRGKSAKQKGT